MQRLPEPLDVHLLDLDPNNPRLPEELQGQSQADILTYLWENDVLEELMDSFLANGFFQSEPLIVLPPQGDRRVVVEGNRRLAALMILHQLPPAVLADISAPSDPSPTPAQLNELERLPSVEASGPEDVAAFLGFRHISGLKRWGPEAKARWLFIQVEARHRNQSERGVFYDVGRQVGGNARGIRSSYIAYAILRHARDILKVDARVVKYVSGERFGVWTRLLGTANVTVYLGMGTRIGATYSEVREQIEVIDSARLEEVLSDLTPGSNQKAILGDSREVTDYSDVIANEPARSAMREFRSLSLAVEIARQGELAGRLRELTRTIEVLTLDVRRYEISESEVAAAEELAASARSLRGAIVAASLDPDE
jgi:hypothetical protein